MRSGGAIRSSSSARARASRSICAIFGSSARRSRPGSGNRLCSLRGADAFEGLIQIRDEVVRVLEPDMEPYQRSLGSPAGRRAVGRDVARDRQALEAAPGITEPEQGQAVEERLDGPVRAGSEHDAEEARRALEVALPEVVAGIALERRIEDARDLGTRL